jgi:hypothetical protein
MTAPTCLACRRDRTGEPTRAAVDHARRRHTVNEESTDA